MKRVFAITVTILAAFAAGAYGQPSYFDTQRDVEERIGDVLSRMTLEEKVAMLHAQSTFSSAGVPRLGIPALNMSDGPHGVRAEINWNDFDYARHTDDYCTAFPSLTCLAATFDLRLAEVYGTALGEEARYRNKNVMLGPGVNIYRTPLNGRNFEYMGEDPFLASQMVVPYIRGVQKNGVAACVKHFALNNQETWRHQVDVQVSERALREIYLPAFEAAVKKGGAWAVMGSYNLVRGVHGCQNDYLLNRILKGEWAFDGVVVSDWGGVYDTREAACGGLDIEMGTNLPFDSYHMAEPLLAAVRAGEVDESVIDDKVRRILRLIFRTDDAQRQTYGSLASEEHSAAAREIAAQGMVLLKNDGGFFPIPENRYSKIVVIGENAVKRLVTGGGSSELKVRREISPLEALREVYGEENVVYSKGYASGPSRYGRVVESYENADSLREAAVALAADAEVVLYFGGLNKNHRQDCESADRESFGLPFGQDRLIAELLAANPNTGLILNGGNAVAMPWIEDVKAVIWCWYGGSQAGYAVADVISGAANPSGRLPFTFPVRLEDNAAHHFGEESYPGVDMKETYSEDIYVGYRWHDTKHIEPLFSFGHGLSYTTFGYGAPKTDKRTYGAGDTIAVTFTISNTGGVRGAETAQIYVSELDPQLPRPVKELKGFEKVWLDAGEKRSVTVNIPVSSLACYDEAAGEWQLGDGKYRISLAASAGDVRGCTDIKINTK